MKSILNSLQPFPKTEIPYRTEALLQREKLSFWPMMGELGLDSAAAYEKDEQIYLKLKDALGSTETWKAYTSAFLIGRLKLNSKTLNDKLIVESMLQLKKEKRCDVAIELSMSIALQGNVDFGIRNLRLLLENPEPLEDQYKAAFYLAQFGDLSGFEIFKKTLSDDIPHIRLMAMRHLLGFSPFDGQKVNGQVIQTSELLKKFIHDSDESIRSEVPFYLKEMKVKNWRTILKNLIETDSSETVINAAKMALYKKAP